MSPGTGGRAITGPLSIKRTDHSYSLGVYLFYESIGFWRAGKFTGHQSTKIALRGAEIGGRRPAPRHAFERSENRSKAPRTREFPWKAIPQKKNRTAASAIRARPGSNWAVRPEGTADEKPELPIPRPGGNRFNGKTVLRRGGGVSPGNLVRFGRYWCCCGGGVGFSGHDTADCWLLTKLFKTKGDALRQRRRKIAQRAAARKKGALEDSPREGKRSRLPFFEVVLKEDWPLFGPGRKMAFQFAGKACCNKLGCRWRY